MLKRLNSILLAAIIVLSLSLCVQAHEVPDLTANDCTIRVDIKSDGEPVPGGSLMLYRVADIHEDDGNYFYQWNEDFAGSMLQMEVQSDTVAKELLEYAVENEYEPLDIEEVNVEGRAIFVDLTPGLYLVAQAEPAEGYLGFSPFLVSLPNFENGSYNYHVNASPKVDDIPVAPTVPETSEPPDEPDEKLPQTGQLNWPIPMMVVGGLLLFVLGLCLRSGKRKDAYEE